MMALPCGRPALPSVPSATILPSRSTLQLLQPLLLPCKPAGSALSSRAALLLFAYQARLPYPNLPSSFGATSLASPLLATTERFHDTIVQGAPIMPLAGFVPNQGVDVRPFLFSRSPLLLLSRFHTQKETAKGRGILLLLETAQAAAAAAGLPLPVSSTFTTPKRDNDDERLVLDYPEFTSPERKEDLLAAPLEPLVYPRTVPLSAHIYHLVQAACPARSSSL